MSLDVHLYRPYLISYDEGKTLEPRRELLYNANITHNLNKMATKAGIYEALWRPYQLKPDYPGFDDHKAEWEYEDANPVRGYEIIDVIEKGLDDMKKRPEYYKKFNSPNGWGTYENFLSFIEKYLIALKQFPEAIVVCDR
jgi:hypothetical protein